MPTGIHLYPWRNVPLLPLFEVIAGPKNPAIIGELAQLVEHLLCKQAVRGSSPLLSTLHRYKTASLSEVRAVRR